MAGTKQGGLKAAQKNLANIRTFTQKSAQRAEETVKREDLHKTLNATAT